MTAQSKSKVALVTGASTGIGRAIAEQLAADGFTVIGASRNIKEAAGDKIKVMQLDVCDDSSVKACVTKVIAEFGGIDVLVNNAGYLLNGAVEEVSIEAAKAQFETNFFGAVRMIQAVLPHMREKRSGQIINVTSLAGLVPLPFWGFYNASKAALESVTETLRQELKPFSITVAGVEPGAIKTPFYVNNTANTSMAEYAPWRERFNKIMGQFEQAAPGPDVVAKKVSRVAQTRSPALHNKVTREAFLFTFMRTFFPRSFYEFGQRKALRLDDQSF